MFKMFENVNEKVRANEFDVDTLIAEYENEDILVLLETKSDGSKNDAYFNYTVLKKETGTYGYVNLDDIEFENEIEGKIYNNNLLKKDIENEMKSITERFLVPIC